MLTFEQKLEIIKKLRPIDDVMFAAIAKDADVCEEIIRTILQNNDIKVISVNTQYEIRNIYGRSVILDALCDLGDGRKCNIEVQKSDNDNHIKRMRYNRACITADTSQTGTGFEEIPDVICIYITDFDIFKKGRTTYYTGECIIGTGELIDDGSVNVYVNTKVNDESMIAELMQCFIREYPDDANFPKLSARINEIKNTNGGRSGMCDLINMYMADELNAKLTEGRAEGLLEGHTKGLLEGHTKGRAEERALMARRMHENNVPIEIISKCTTLAVDKLMEILEPAMA